MSVLPDKYWSLLEPRSQDFWDGVAAGIRAFAVWKDGGQFVGIMRRPLSTVLAELPKAESEDDDNGKDPQVP